MKNKEQAPVGIRAKMRHRSLYEVVMTDPDSTWYLEADDGRIAWTPGST